MLKIKFIWNLFICYIWERFIIDLFKITNENNEEVVTKGDEIIKLQDGSLTTMYHYMKNSETEIEEILTSEKFENIDLWLN